MNNMNLTPESEAALNRWAAEFAKFHAVEVGVGGSRMKTVWAQSDADGVITKEYPRGAFTRSLDAAREVVLAVTAIPDKNVNFLRHLNDSGPEDFHFPGYVNIWGPNYTKESMRQAWGMMRGLTATPLEIVLAAYFAIEGRDWNPADAGESEDE